MYDCEGGAISSSFFSWDISSGLLVSSYAYYRHRSHSILFIIQTNGALSQTSYTGGSITVSFNLNDSVYGIINPGDSMLINITRYKGAMVEGGFSGTISTRNSTKKLIAQGSFQNLKLYP